MKNICIIIACFGICIINAQVLDGIDLPNYGGPSEMVQKDFRYTFYITANEELYFEEKRLRYWDEVVTSILSRQRAKLRNGETPIAIFADKNVSMDFVERLRTEIVKCWSNNINYAGREGGQPRFLTLFTSGPSFPVKVVMEEGYLMEKAGNFIYSAAEKTAGVWQGSPPPPPPLYQKVWGQMMYSDDKAPIKELLDNVNFGHGAMTVLTANSFLWKGKEYTFADGKSLKALVESLEHVLFIKPSKGLSYGEYFNALASIQAFRNFVPNSMHSHIRKPHIMEVDHVLEKELLKNGIDLFGTLE